MSDQDETRITWHIDVPSNTTVKIDTSSQEVETRIQPIQKHDGRLDKDGSFTVYYDDVWSNAHDDAVQGIHVLHRNSSYGHVTFTPKQALSLLAWLKENEATLEKLAKEHTE